MDQFLATKLYIPPLRPELVSRPRLIELLNANLHRKLTLISAPAGFGKTTLVSEWVTGSERPVAWLSLDEGDNDTARFLAYFITALNQIEGIDAALGEGALRMLQSPQPPPLETILTSLINEFVSIPDRIILVLDDYHNIESTPIDDALAFILKHLPPQLQLVIATRVDPQLPLARLRARGQLTELRAADLRFTSTEIASFLNHVMGLDLAADDIAALETRTEGWITGLQLAAISMHGSKDVKGFIKSFTGSHRHVLDYLIEEVLEQQPEGTKYFLLKTSILDRLTGSLCDALTGRDNSQAVLEMLGRTNLFIVHLDENRQWYRYHYLFADLLRQRLRQTDPDHILILHRKASEWCEQNGSFYDAIEYALRADDFDRAAPLIEKHVDTLWDRGEHVKLWRWLVKLPVEMVFSRPYLCIFHTWYLFSSGQQDAAEQSLQACEQALNSNGDYSNHTMQPEKVSLDNLERGKLRGRYAAIRAFMDSYQGDVPGIIKHARQALEYLPEQDRTWRRIVAIVLSDVYGFKGDMKAAYEARYEALQACKAAGEIYYELLASAKLAITLRSQGHLQRTMEICQQQIQVADDCGLAQSPLKGLLFLIMGEVLAELNELDAALAQAMKGFELAEHGVDLAMRGWGYLCLVRILFSRSELDAVEKLIRRFEKNVRETKAPPWIVNQMAAWQARLWLKQGKLGKVTQWLLKSGYDTFLETEPPHEIDYFSLFDYIIYARLLIAHGRLEEAITLLLRLHEATEEAGRTARAIEILALQALASQGQGDTDRAITSLEKALALAEPEGFIRIFVDEGPPMARLLYEALSHGISPDYIRRLLGAFPDTATEQIVPAQIQVQESLLVEPLSEREIEVLQLIADGLTNQEVSSRLYLSLNTIKVHTRNIYGKLGVNNRTQAGARARALGILPYN